MKPKELKDYERDVQKDEKKGVITTKLKVKIRQQELKQEKDQAARKF